MFLKWLSGALVGVGGADFIGEQRRTDGAGPGQARCLAPGQFSH